ncbi:MAG: sterol desaturase family protein [Blastocatellia bacterium]|nr:sterol desaturase family protein [Blastocatellia bacterium]MDQ3219249.1 sterol desaturase family protein [Acidobacteriota bacterium]
MTLGKIIRELAFPIAVATFGVLVLLERKRPLRRETEPVARRTGRNLFVAGTAAVAMALIEIPIAKRAASMVERKNVGLLKLFKLPEWLEISLAVILLDYTLYLWHVLTHRVPFLWRFHVVHHVDLDLDASTALRFHFGELIASVGWRAIQIAVIGVTPKSLQIWQALLIPSILFHHSNVELPERLEKFLSKFIVTPRLHGIHHSVFRAETDSNWSSGLSVWDRLHGTFREVTEHADVKIGVPAHQDPRTLTIGKLLAFPLRPHRDCWQLPDKYLMDEPNDQHNHPNI